MSSGPMPSDPPRPPRSLGRNLPTVPGFGEEDEPTQIGQISDLKKGKSKRDRAYFIVLAGSNVGHMYRVEGGDSLIGRSSEATIRLQDDGISRRHARVFQVKDEVWIEDLKSANGTLVNGSLVETRGLKDGDKIQVGSTTILKFTYHDELEENFQQQMYSAALYDALTKAYNKKYFLDRLQTELAYARRHDSHLSLVILDIDHFKKVNDTYGHLAGDLVLSQLSGVAMSALRAEDVFARYGGEEFAIICRGVPQASVIVLAERIRTLVEATPFEYQTQRIPITVSMGLASCPETKAETPTDLIIVADARLYEAKRGGRNRLVSTGGQPSEG